MSAADTAAPSETTLADIDVDTFTRVRAAVSADASLVRVRIYTPDRRTLLADIGVSPNRARAIGAAFLAGAARLDPVDVRPVAKSGGSDGV